MPTHMGVESRKVWRRIIRDYGHTGVLTAADADILRSYCDAVARYEKASRILDESSPLIKGRHGDLVKNPLHQIVRDNAVLVRSLARELGLTPSSRTGLTGNEAPTGDPLEAFLGGAS
jgi:P27 family predicted phage terminase small subunit